MQHQERLGSSLTRMLQRSIKSVWEVTWRGFYSVASKASGPLLEKDASTSFRKLLHKNVTMWHQKRLGSYFKRSYSLESSMYVNIDSTLLQPPRTPRTPQIPLETCAPQTLQKRQQSRPRGAPLPKTSQHGRLSKVKILIDHMTVCQNVCSWFGWQIASPCVQLLVWFLKLWLIKIVWNPAFDVWSRS